MYLYICRASHTFDSVPITNLQVSATTPTYTYTQTYASRKQLFNTYLCLHINENGVYL